MTDSFFTITDAEGEPVAVASELDDDGNHIQVFYPAEED